MAKEGARRGGPGPQGCHVDPPLPRDCPGRLRDRLAPSPGGPEVPLSLSLSLSGIGGSLPHWLGVAGRGAVGSGDWLLGAQAPRGARMAAPVRRSVVFVTGNAKKLEEVGGRLPGNARRRPGLAGPGPDGRVSLPFPFLLPPQVTQILGDSSPYTLVAKKIDRKLPAGPGGTRRLGLAVSSVPTLCL